MRIAVISDIHGNIHALEAVLADIKKQSVDQIVVAGDSVNVHPNSRACWDRVMSLGCTVLQGNHEFYLYAYGTPEADPAWETERFQGMRWARSQFEPDQLERMRALSWAFRLPELLVVHASARSLFDNVLRSTSHDELRTFFANTNESLIVRGHNHHWVEHHWDDRRLLSLDSCGLPLDKDLAAPYGLLTWGGGWVYEKRRVPYDHQAAIAAMDEAYIGNVGPLGWIFRREAQTATMYLVPFLRFYFPRADLLSFEDAVRAYLLERDGYFGFEG